MAYLDILPTTSAERRIKVRVGEKSPSILILKGDSSSDFKLYDNSNPHATSFKGTIVQASSTDANIAKWNHADSTISGVKIGTCEINIAYSEETSETKTVYVEVIAAGSESAGGSIDKTADVRLDLTGENKTTTMLVSGYEADAQVYRDVFRQNIKVNSKQLNATSRQYTITSEALNGEAILYFYFFSTEQKATTKATAFFYCKAQAQTLLEIAPSTLTLKAGEQGEIAVNTNAESYTVSFDSTLINEVAKESNIYRFSALQSGSASLTFNAQKSGDLAASAIAAVNIEVNSLDTLLAQIESILGENNAWIEQIRLTLTASRELLNEFEYLKNTYKSILTSLSTAEASVKYVKAEFNTLAENTRLNLNNILERATELKAELETLSTQAAESATNAQQALIDSQAVKDSVDSSLLEIQNLKAQVETTHALLENFQNTLNEIKTLLTQANTIKGELETFAITKKTELNAHKDTLEAEMTAHKDLILGEIENKKQEIQNTFDEKMALLTATQTTFTSDLQAIKEDILNQVSTMIQSMQTAQDSSQT